MHLSRLASGARRPTTDDSLVGASSSKGRRPIWIGLAAGTGLLLSACGGGEEATAEVATLETELSSVGEPAGALTSDAESQAELMPDEAALQFSQCMRDEGLDFPDLSVDADGNIDLREAFQSVDRGAEGFRDAQQACDEILSATGFGGGGRQAAAESPEVQDGLLAFSDCVRDAGYDVGDLTLQRPGQGAGQGAAQGAADQGAANAQAAEPAAGDSAADGAGNQPPGGQRQQGFGNRAARFATGLGLDYEDPAVQETIDDCSPIIDEAFAAAGLGQPDGAQQGSQG